MVKITYIKSLIDTNDQVRPKLTSLQVYYVITTASSYFGDCYVGYNVLQLCERLKTSYCYSLAFWLRYQLAQ